MAQPELYMYAGREEGFVCLFPKQFVSSAIPLLHSAIRPTPSRANVNTPTRYKYLPTFGYPCFSLLGPTPHFLLGSSCMTVPWRAPLRKMAAGEPANNNDETGIPTRA